LPANARRKSTGSRRKYGRRGDFERECIFFAKIGFQIGGKDTEFQKMLGNGMPRPHTIQPDSAKKMKKKNSNTSKACYKKVATNVAPQIVYILKLPR
jgi:hypothetical protein